MHDREKMRVKFDRKASYFATESEGMQLRASNAWFGATALASLAASEQAIASVLAQQLIGCEVGA
jgi:hypothetical protein